ncbi:MAG: hypothetical protein ACP5N2_02810 [Candidatus Nanoarchaeia archaeon]
MDRLEISAEQEWVEKQAIEKSDGNITLYAPSRSNFEILGAFEEMADPYSLSVIRGTKEEKTEVVAMPRSKLAQGKKILSLNSDSNSERREFRSEVHIKSLRYDPNISSLVALLYSKHDIDGINVITSQNEIVGVFAYPVDYASLVVGPRIDTGSSKYFALRTTFSGTSLRKVQNSLTDLGENDMMGEFVISEKSVTARFAKQISLGSLVFHEDQKFGNDEIIGLGYFKSHIAINMQGDEVGIFPKDKELNPSSLISFEQEDDSRGLAAMTFDGKELWSINSINQYDALNNSISNSSKRMQTMYKLTNYTALPSSLRYLRGRFVFLLDDYKTVAAISKDSIR